MLGLYFSMAKRIAREDVDKCYVAQEDFDYEVREEFLDKLAGMVAVSEDEMGSESCNTGVTFNVCNGVATHLLFDPKEGRFYLLREEYTSVVSGTSNAVEVCDSHGCTLVPACLTGTKSYDYHVELIPADEEGYSVEELIELVGDDKPTPAAKLLYTMVSDALTKAEIEYPENITKATELLGVLKEKAINAPAISGSAKEIINRRLLLA